MLPESGITGSWCAVHAILASYRKCPRKPQAMIDFPLPFLFMCRSSTPSVLVSIREYYNIG